MLREAKRRSMLLGGAAALTASLLSAFAPAAAATGRVAPCTPYQLPGLPGGDGNGSVITISDSGLYGGSAEDASGVVRAVYWTHSGAVMSSGWTTHLVPSGLANDFIGDINPSGVMVGNGDDQLTGTQRSYLYNVTAGTVTWLPSLGGGDNEARRLNAGGVAAGFSIDPRGVAFAVIWSPPYTSVNKLPSAAAQSVGGGRDGSHTKMFSEALAINDHGQAVGESAIGAPIPDTGYWASTHQWRGALTPLFRPMTWSPTGAPHKLPVGYSQGFAWDINNAGLMVGDSDIDASLTARPAYWISGQYHDMGAPADIAYGNAYTLSQGGWAAGGIVLADGTGRAFIWTGAGALQILGPAAPFTDSWSHGPNDVLHQIGGDMFNNTSDIATVWQCPTGFTTG